MTISSTIIADPDAARELQELNALHLDLALTQARIDAAIERLLEAGPSSVLTVPRYSVEGNDGILPGSPAHVIREEKREGGPDGATWTKRRVHTVERCDGRWCHEDRRARRGGDTEFWFAYEGLWRLTAWRDGEAILVREAASA